MINHKNKYNILHNLQRIDAYDGKLIKELTNLPFSVEISQNQKKNILNYGSVSGGMLSYGGVGCALSHRAILDIIIKNNYEDTLIFEDDIEFIPNFSELLATLKIPSDYDLFYLGYSSAYSTTPFDENINKCHRVYGTYGIIISLKGAQKLVNELKLFNPLKYALDTAYYFNIDQCKINKYCLMKEKRLLYQTCQNSKTNPSDIIV